MGEESAVYRDCDGEPLTGLDRAQRTREHLLWEAGDGRVANELGNTSPGRHPLVRITLERDSGGESDTINVY